ncbi:ribonuclease H2, subunit B [Trametes polyzona]|nr:ribonuclease H2, subunit B [Trametes polyzona]
MSCHFGILPADLLQAISRQLESHPPDEGANGAPNGLRLLRLPHPRTGIPSLFVPHETPETSVVLEVQSISPPNRRSWFTEEEVAEDGKLLVMTPVDPAFLLIRLLQCTLPADGTPGNFRPADDIIEEAAAKVASSAVEGGQTVTSDDILHLSTLRCIPLAMRRVCEFKEITPDITVFRYSPDRTLECLRAKVSRLSHESISELSRTLNRNLAKDGLLEDGKEELLAAARIRGACDLLSQYLPRNVFERLLSTYDFASLDAHMKALKEESMALAAVNMNAVEAKESKEQKSTGTDKKRKAKGSHGVEQLKKANTKGMAKLSTFFQKK